jgi:glycosyltransferase involved in cell wall biosynthesis
MKILFVITGLSMGGAERQVCDLADNLASRGYQVRIAHLLNPVVVNPRSKEVEVLWLGGGMSIVSMLKAFLSLRLLIKKERPDVVHSHMFHANILTRLVRMLVPLQRLICTAHNSDEGGKMRMLAYRLTNVMADSFTNVSREAVEAFESKKAVSVGRMMTTHNGIDVDLFKFNGDSRNHLRRHYCLEGKKTIVAVGRFHAQKDYPNLLSAFATIAKKYPNTRLLIIGDGELRVSVERIIQDTHLAENVTLLGIRSDVADVLSAADVFVLPSAWEGFGLVVAEAMACERVVVATDCGGVAEVLGDDGYLVPPRNSSALAEAMEQAIALTEAEAKTIGVSARSRVLGRYSLDGVVDNWLRIYTA